MNTIILAVTIIVGSAPVAKPAPQKVYTCSAPRESLVGGSVRTCEWVAPANGLK